MNELTREEAACFRTALALVVVKKRLEQKQPQPMTAPPPTNNGDHRKRSDDHPDNHHAKTPAKKLKLQTMDALIFPHWAATAEEEKEETNDMEKPRAAVITPARLQHVQLKQGEHLQNMMDTAIRTALCLVPENQEPQQQAPQEKSQQQRKDAPMTPMTQPASRKDTQTKNENSQQQQQQAAWSTLGALSLHLAQQISFALKVTRMPTNQQNDSTDSKEMTPSTTKAPSPSGQWVADWVRNSLRQLLTQESSPRTMDAAFLVWHGILLGGFSPDNNCKTKAHSTKATSMTPNYPACQSLFRQVFCDLLQEFGIVKVNSSHAALPLPPKGFADDTSTVTTAGTNDRDGGSDTKEKQHNTAGRGRSETATSSRIASIKAAQRGGNSHGGTKALRGTCYNAEDRMDQWLVHGLQLLQKLAQADKKKNCGPALSASTSRLLHRLHPDSFLPPTDLVMWYAESTAHLSKSAKPKAREPAPPQKSLLGPGATLMTMVALYQTLKDE